MDIRKIVSSTILLVFVLLFFRLFIVISFGLMTFKVENWLDFKQREQVLKWTDN